MWWIIIFNGMSKKRVGIEKMEWTLKWDEIDVGTKTNKSINEALIKTGHAGRRQTTAFMKYVEYVLTGHLQ